MKLDYANAPVTEPYARDMILEAHRLLLNTHPYAEHMIFVEFYDIEGMALHKDDAVIFYHPGVIKQIPLDNLCRILTTVLHNYGMHLSEEHAPPSGTLLH